MSNLDIANYIYEEPTEGNFKPLPPGDYPFRVKEVYQWEHSQRGIPYIPMMLEILDEEGRGIKEVRDSLFFSEGAKFRIDQFIASVSDSLTPGDKVDFTNPSFLKHKEGLLTLGQKPGEKEGTIFNEVKAYLFKKVENTPEPEPEEDENPF